jgi:hypothetical protein
MYHIELGKTTMEIYDEEYVSNPEKGLYLSRLRQQIANVLQRRVEQLAALENEVEQQPIQDRVGEGSPVYDKQQGGNDD